MVTVVISVSVTSPCVPVYAADNNDLIIQNVNRASKILEQAINESYADAKKCVKQECVKDSLDFNCTMQSFYLQENPYKNAEYVDLISAYMISKEYTTTFNLSDFYSLPFVKVDIKNAVMDEYIPMLIQDYDETDDGYYVKGEKIYIDSPTDVNMYHYEGDGKYTVTGSKTITPETKSTKYGEVTLTGMSGEDILKYYGLNNNSAAVKSYNNKKDKLNNLVYSKGINESLFLYFEKNMSKQDSDYISQLTKEQGISTDRKNLVLTAASLIGKVPYDWGGKPQFAGYDKSWWSLDDEGNQKGLDCSGFVQWSFITTGYDSSITNNLLSTSMILKSLPTIDKDSLQVGDIGLLNNGDIEQINHTGIYAGDGKWIHCSSGKGTVVMERTDMFSIYKRMPDFEGENDTTTNLKNYTDEITEYNNECEYSEDDVLLLAKLICNEAGGEGLNGWIGVAEVVKNRLDSDDFPDNVSDVTYQDGQFSDNDKIASRQPSDEQIKVAREVLSGNLTYFGNSDVLYFRNAKGSQEDWGKHRHYGTINNHEFYTK